MNRLLDKGVLFLLCAIWYLGNMYGMYAVVPVLAAVSVGALMSLFERDLLCCGLFVTYAVVCLFAPGAVCFLPFICYDAFVPRKCRLLLLSVIPLGAALHLGGMRLVVWIVFLGVISFAMRWRTGMNEKLKADSIAARDFARETELALTEKNRALMEKQDYEVRLATLTERNRIARDIHDSVGHLLSSSILQIGALLAVPEAEPLRENLQTLKHTLSRGMDSIRADLHGLHDQSVSLQMEAKRLTKNFSFCPLELNYDMENEPPNKIRYTLIFVLKEALTNIIKHSNATCVHVLLREHPGFYQLIVQDNGLTQGAASGPGLGLRNITERVEGLGGRVRFGGKKGFVVFVTIPRGAVE